MHKKSIQKNYNKITEKPSNPHNLVEGNDELPSILKGLPTKQREVILSHISQRTEISHYQGIIPPPDHIELYNKIIPNGADRIMQMAERQQAHRIEIEFTVVKSQQKQSERGQLFGLILGITGLLIAACLALNGHETTGSIIGGSTVISLVSVFVIGKTKQRNDLKTKKEASQDK